MIYGNLYYAEGGDAYPKHKLAFMPKVDKTDSGRIWFLRATESHFKLLSEKTHVLYIHTGYEGEETDEEVLYEILCQFTKSRY